MKHAVLGVLLFITGCASSQDGTARNDWKITRLEGYKLQEENMKIDTVRGTGKVLVFERTVGRIAVDAGYIERLWLQVNENEDSLRIPDQGGGYYEQVCRCEHAGFHKIVEGNIMWSEDDARSKVTGYIWLKNRKIEW